MTTTLTNAKTNGRAPDLRSTLGRVTGRGPIRRGQLAGAVLFVVLVVVLLAAVFRAQGDRVEVLVVKRPVAAGQVIEAADLGTAEVAGVDGAVPATSAATIVGDRAAQGLVEGQVVTRSAVSGTPVPAAGQRLVALRLDVGRVPGGLAAGDLVDVIVVPADGDPGAAEDLTAPQRLARGARVESVGSTADTAAVVTVLVAEEAADSVAAHAAAGRLTIVQAPVGE